MSQEGALVNFDLGLYARTVSRKNGKIAALIASFTGQQIDPHYLAYFDCFNRRRFFEAHEVLEALWLPQRQGPEGAFYKGLIQLAGAFVHWQKGRRLPSLALFKLAAKNLHAYGAAYRGLDLRSLAGRIGQWEREVGAGDELCAADVSLRLTAACPGALASPGGDDDAVCPTTGAAPAGGEVP